MNRILKRIKIASNLLKYAEEEHFNAKQMKFLREMMDSQLLSNELMRYIADRISDNVIKGVRVLMEHQYGDEPVYKTMVYIANNELSGRKFDLFVKYIDFRKTEVSVDDMYSFVNVYKDSNYDKLSDNNFRAIFNGGIFVRVYRSCNVPIGTSEANEIFNLCNEYIGDINDSNVQTLIDLACVSLLGGDDAHIDLMYEYDTKGNHTDKDVNRYVRDLMANNENIDVLNIVIKHNDLSIQDIDNLLEYSEINDDLKQVDKLLSSGLTMDEALTYNVDNEDINKYMNDYNNYVDEQDAIDEEENKDQYLRFSKKKRLIKK